MRASSALARARRDVLRRERERREAQQRRRAGAGRQERNEGGERLALGGGVAALAGEAGERLERSARGLPVWPVSERGAEGLLAAGDARGDRGEAGLGEAPGGLRLAPGLGAARALEERPRGLCRVAGCLGELRPQLEELVRRLRLARRVAERRAGGVELAGLREQAGARAERGSRLGRGRGRVGGEPGEQGGPGGGRDVGGARRGRHGAQGADVPGLVLERVEREARRAGGIERDEEVRELEPDARGVARRRRARADARATRASSTCAPAARWSAASRARAGSSSGVASQ